MLTWAADIGYARMDVSAFIRADSFEAEILHQIAGRVVKNMQQSDQNLAGEIANRVLKGLGGR